MWEEEHPPIGFRNSTEGIVFAQFVTLGIVSSWVLGTEHTMAITMLTVVGVLSLLLYFIHSQHGLFDSKRKARRFWLLLLPVLYALVVYVIGFALAPTLQTVVVGGESFMVLREQSPLAPVGTLSFLGWPSLAFSCGVFIASIGLLCFIKGTFVFWRLLWVLSISATILAAVGWLLWLIGVNRLYFFITPPQEVFFATFTHPHYWAVFALVWSIVLGGLILQKKAQRDWTDFFADKGLLLIIAFGVLLSSVIPSGAPAHHGVGGLVLGYFFLLIAIEQWQKKTHFTSIVFWLLTIVSCVFSINLLLAAFLDGTGVAAPLGMPLAEQRSLWQDAWSLFTARPLFGWGVGGFAAIHPFIQSTDLESFRYNYPSSDLLLALADRGVLGTLVAFAVPAGIGVAFLRLKKRKDLSYCLLLAPVVIGVFALVSNPLQSPPILLSFYLLLVTAYQWSRLDTSEAFTSSSATRLIQPETHLRNTPNSRKQRTSVNLPKQSGRAKPSVATLPHTRGAQTATTDPADDANDRASPQPPFAAADAQTATDAQAAANTHVSATPQTAGTQAAIAPLPAATHAQAAATEEQEGLFDLIVIGGGSAGYAAASAMQRAGKKVAIIDAATELGGLCILRGCMPSKTLIYSAEVLHLAQKGKLFGLDIPQAKVDMPALHARKKQVIGEFADYRRGQLQSDRFTLYRQSARFTAPRSLELADGTVLQGRKILIATGSRVNVPQIPGLAQTPCWTSDDVLELSFVPKSVIVLGGGVVACELAQFLARIGTKVTLIQRNARLLKEQPPEASAVVVKAFTDEGIEVITDTALEEIQALPEGGVQVTFTHKGQSETRRAEHLFNALGRRPNTDGLDLEKAGIALRDSGHIAVNAFQQTSNADVYAAGDVAGPHEIVHVAILQAEVAARHALHEKTAPVDTSALTSVVFTDPQIACAGPSDAELKERGIETVSAQYPFDDHGKSILMEAKYGYVKTVVNKADGRLLAAECVGKDASELIHAMAVAITLKARAADLLAAHWYHPTLSEIWTYPLEDCVDALQEGA